MTFRDCLVGLAALVDAHEGEGRFRKIVESLDDGDGLEQVVTDGQIVAYAAGYLRGAAECADLTVLGLLEEFLATPPPERPLELVVVHRFDCDMDEDCSCGRSCSFVSHAEEVCCCLRCGQQIQLGEIVCLTEDAFPFCSWECLSQVERALERPL